MKKIISTLTLCSLFLVLLATAVLAAAPKKNLFNSIKDALSRSLTLKCEYKEGKGKVTAYIKKGAIRVDSFQMGNQGSGNIILKNYRMWTWSDAKKEGYIFDIPKTKENSQEARDKELMKDLEKNKKFCKAAVVADSKFLPPTNVTFVNLAEQMKKLQNAIPSIPAIKDIPTSEEGQ